jgi:hypothetical protein
VALEEEMRVVVGLDGRLVGTVVGCVVVVVVVVVVVGCVLGGWLRVGRGG